MKLSIYLGEDRVQIVVGKWKDKIQIVDCRQYLLPKGTLINDVIIHEESLRNVLLDIKQTYAFYRSRIYLMIGSNQSVNKVMRIPSMPKSAMKRLVQKELESLIGPQKNMIYDYSEIGPHTILGAGLELEKLLRYQELFLSCGMKLKMVNIALNGTIHLTQNLTALKNKTFILCLTDGRNMMISLYKDGSYIYTSRVRLLSERKTFEAVKEMVKNIEAMIQFYYLQRYEDELEAVYTAGLEATEKAWMHLHIKECLYIDMADITYEEDFVISDHAEFSLEQYFYPIGNMIGGFG